MEAEGVITITTTGNEQIQGKLFAVDNASEFLVLQKYSSTGATQEYVLLNSDEVQDIQGELQVSMDEKVLSTVCATNLATREQQGLRRAEEVLRSINADVSAETQALYDALARTLPCRWEGTAIVVLDQVKINPPYTEEACVSLDGVELTLNRVKRVLQGEKTKLQRQAQQSKS